MIAKSIPLHQITSIQIDLFYADCQTNASSIGSKARLFAPFKRKGSFSQCVTSREGVEGLYFLLSVLSNVTAYAASKGAGVCTVKRYKELCNIKQPPQPAEPTELSTGCFPDLHGNIEIWGK